MSVGIEAMNFYTSPTSLDVRTLFKARGLDLDRFENLMMSKKSVGLPCEDSVTNGVNAAKPVIDQLSEKEKSSIELVITASESGLDFGKSLSTYIHDYLGLSKNCRLFEVKQACYGGTAALHMAINFIASNVSPGAKALVIATDTAKASIKMTYSEPSQGTGAVAMLVSNDPRILEIDLGATGYYGYEVMDTCRPEPEIETGDSDLSLLSYLDCMEHSYNAYTSKVDNVDYQNTFDYLVFHTPFAGMVKGGHRKMMRQFKKMKGDLIEQDFNQRVQPSINYCVEVGNVYSATVYLALCSLIDNSNLDTDKRVGIFSYGSGCSSEFYSGVIKQDAKQHMSSMGIKQNLDNRYALTVDEYDNILDISMDWVFGTKDKTVDFESFSDQYKHAMEGKNYLVLNKVDNYHRQYIWS